MDGNVIVAIDNLITGLNQYLMDMTMNDVEISWQELDCTIWQVEEWLNDRNIDHEGAGWNMVDLRKELSNIRDILVARLDVLNPTGIGCMSDCPAVRNTEGTGRPRFVFDMEVVGYLMDIGFNVKTIVRMCMTSRTTLWRRIRELGHNTNRYSNISDEELLS